jgi:hypothetical protein
MHPINRTPIGLLSISLLWSITLIYAAHGQTRPQEPLPAQADEVVRINTDLMQVEVTVVDKQGRFVEGLQRE